MSRNMGMKGGLISSGGSLFCHKGSKSAPQNVPRRKKKEMMKAVWYMTGIKSMQSLQLLFMSS